MELLEDVVVALVALRRGLGFGGVFMFDFVEEVLRFFKEAWVPDGPEVRMLVCASPLAAVWMDMAFDILMHCCFAVPVKAELLRYLDATMDAHDGTELALDVLWWINVLLLYRSNRMASSTLVAEGGQAIIEAFLYILLDMACPRNVPEHQTHPC